MMYKTLVALGLAGMLGACSQTDTTESSATAPETTPEITATEQMKEKAAELVETAGDAIKEQTEAVTEKAAETMEAAQEATSEMTNNIVEKATGMAEQATESLTEMTEQATDPTTDMVEKAAANPVTEAAPTPEVPAANPGQM